MGLQISNDYAGFSTCGIRSTSMYAGKTSVTGERSQAISDTVELSRNGRLKICDLLKGLILPTEENVRELSAALSQDLQSLLNGIGIKIDSPLTFTTSSSGEIQIEGDCADKQKILGAINGNEKVKQEIRTTLAIASHAAGMRESLEFQNEYRASNNPETVVAKYSYLFNSIPRSHRIALAYDSTGTNVLCCGKKWLCGAE